MKFKTDTPSSEERNVIEPISSISPRKSKKQTLTKSASKKKRPSKSKRGETKTSLSMADLYENENPLNSTVVEPSIGVSEKTHKTIDTKVTLKIDADGASPEVEKGNPDKTLNSIVSKSGGKLGLEDLNDAIDSTINMDVDEVDDENVVNNSVQPSAEKTNIRKDVEPDVEAPLGQHDRHDEGSDTPKEDESGLMTATKKGVLSEDTAVKTTSEEEKESDVKTDSEEELPIVKDQEEQVNVNNMDSDDIP